MCGEPATDIDHIDGAGGDELDNLQPLCGDCHRQKSLSELELIFPGDPRHEEAIQRLFDYDSRVAASERPCDNETRWKGIWRQIEKARAAYLSDDVAKARRVVRKGRLRPVDTSQLGDAVG